MSIYFEVEDDKKVVKIMQDGLQIGQIFSPSSSGGHIDNAIQICGFSEAFDYWSCGVFKGFKDIQLLFDNTKFKGRYTSMQNCLRCFHDPCQCENTKKGTNPFNVKREVDLKGRLKYIREE